MRLIKNPLFLLLFCFVCISALFMGYQYYHVAEEIYRQEIATVQNLAGAVLAEHSELEGKFTDALRGTEYRDVGAQILEKYGYDNQNQLLEDSGRASVLNRANITVAVFVIVILALFVLMWFLFMKKQNNTLQKIQYVLENYLSEDYSFSGSTMDLDMCAADDILRQLSDILKQLGHQIKIKNSRIIDEQESTKALVTDVSHQLKTPIAALKICFSMYLEADTDSEREEFLMRSQMQMDKLESLIGTLINISRLETAMITLRLEAVSLQELLTRAVDSVYIKGQKKGISIVTEPFENTELFIDKKWTTEAIMNVLDNGIKYSPHDSVISITVKPLLNFIRIEITDCGIGILKEEYTKIFSRFYRGAHEQVRQSEGSGVGLYLTRFILEKQGGNIMVKSNANGGSTFILQIKR